MLDFHLSRICTCLIFYLYVLYVFIHLCLIFLSVLCTIILSLSKLVSLSAQG
ncbi:hypothetical protein C1646_681788 [Rhizophagus diaphanus]|nr:hypothetical protein C1646_681788 [Rhizophagus diaphanus] [Rhizophagus sp. MUCL 43196]